MLQTFSIFGLAGGLLRILCSFTAYLEPSDHLELLYIVTDFGLIFGLLATFLIHQAELKALGLVGFMLALTGFSFIAGPNATIYGIESYQIGSPVISLGVLLLSIAQLKSGFYYKVGPASLIASFLLGLVWMFVSPASSLMFAIVGALFGLGFMVNGLYVFRSQSKP